MDGEKTVAEFIQDLKAEVLKYNAELKTAKELIDKKADQTKIDELFKVDADLAKTGILDKMEKNIVTLSDQLDKIQLKMNDSGLKGKAEPWIVSLAKALKGDAFKKAVKKEGKFEVTFTTNPYSIMKVGTMLTDDNLGGFDLDTAVVVPMREPGVFKAPDRALTILDIVQKGTTTSDQIVWVERTARTEGAAVIAEGGIFIESDIHWALKKVPVEKIGTYYKASNESLDDWEYTLSEINTEGIGQLERELEEEVVSGSGVSPHLVGILTHAPAFTYAGLNGFYTKVNIYDLVHAMAAQVRAAGFIPSHYCLNIDDSAKFAGYKDSNGQYVLPPFMGMNGTTIDGMQMVSVTSDLLAPGDVLVGDFSKDKLFMRREITIEMFDQNEDDAKYDLRMIRLKLRAANRIRVCDYAAFCYDRLTDVSALVAAS